MKFIEKNSKIFIIIIFLIGIIVYGFIASKMTNATYLGVDEELYVSMARSFFYDNNFSQEGEILNYNCVIYSIILSATYLIGNNAALTTIMRLIGVVFMISSVFPIYLLANEVLKNKKVALFMSACSLLIPEFTLAFYYVQEVICYPFFLWIVYLVYLKFTKEKTIAIDIIIPIMFAIIYFIKSYAIAFGIAYYITLGLIVVKEKRYKDIERIILSFILFIITLIICLIRSLCN